MAGIYIASKTKHGERWRRFRAAGVPICSTWIDEAGLGETRCFADLWHRCIREAAACDALVVYREGGEELKGAHLEVGAALAHGAPVFHVGPMVGSWFRHSLAVSCLSIESAFMHAASHVRPATVHPFPRPDATLELGSRR